MIRLAANISTMFGEHPFEDRIAAAAQAGFRAGECQFPYDCEAATIKSRLRETGIPMVLMNAPRGDSRRGEVGLAALPGREAEFRDTIGRAVKYASEIGCKQLHVMAGVPAQLYDQDICRQIFIDNIRWAADLGKDRGIRIMIEAINRVDVPGYHLNGADDAVSVLNAVERPNVALQFDAYHSHRMGEKPVKKLLEYIGMITHIQVSGFPGRHEPLDGDIPYREFFAQVEATGYDGWVGCEYVPKTDTVDGLDWAAEYGIGIKAHSE